MMALAVRIDQDEYCCSCALMIAKESQCPHLFFTGLPKALIEGDSLCEACGLRFGRKEAEEAAKQIIEYLKGAKP